MAIAVNCLVNEASRKFACASIFVFLRRSVTPQPCSKSVLPFCRTSTARPGASGEVTPEKTASILFSIELLDRCVCARVYFGVDRTRRMNTEPMSFRITDPPRSEPKDNTRLCKTLAEFVLEGRACFLKRAIYAPESAFRVLFLADSFILMWNLSSGREDTSEGPLFCLMPRQIPEQTGLSAVWLSAPRGGVLYRW